MARKKKPITLLDCSATTRSGYFITDGDGHEYQLVQVRVENHESWYPGMKVHITLTVEMDDLERAHYRMNPHMPIEDYLKRANPTTTAATAGSE